MNFDQLKDEWNNNSAQHQEVSEDMLKIKEARTPIDKIRKQMKQEFLIQVFSLALAAFVPQIFDFSISLKSTYLIFYGVVVAFCTYYFYKFYTFYKHSYDLSIDSRKNLLWFYYEMKLNIELYKALTYIIGFIMLSFCATALFLTKNDLLQRILEKLSLVYLALNAFIAILIIGVITELWARFYYGKYIKEIKVIIDSLDEE
ncbi:hypothetical protein [Pedobacter nanyangensis]|uniref:hypothetical protein n=1 Tax=Pedobacter nanyangensis TaxID=1562389 RepID=UPI000DE4D28F|nr:hypothetical protein [Pedobacter nanyangensis]